MQELHKVKREGGGVHIFEWLKLAYADLGLPHRELEMLERIRKRGDGK